MRAGVIGRGIGGSGGLHRLSVGENIVVTRKGDQLQGECSADEVQPRLSDPSLRREPDSRSRDEPVEKIVAGALAPGERFRRGAVREYRAELRKCSDMNHIEAAILDRVAKLNPEVFQTLETFCREHAAYVGEGVARFDREVQFYVAYLGFIGRLREAGLSFCYPVLSTSSTEISNRDTFDIALAARQVAEQAQVVTNEFHLRDGERIGDRAAGGDRAPREARQGGLRDTSLRLPASPGAGASEGGALPASGAARGRHAHVQARRG